MKTRSLKSFNFFALTFFTVLAHGWLYSDQGRAKESAELKTQAIQVQENRVVIPNRTKFFKNWKLEEYHQDLKDLTFGDGLVQLRFDNEKLSYLQDVEAPLEKTPQGWRWSYEDEKISIEKRYGYQRSEPVVNVEVDIDFKQEKVTPDNAFLTLVSKSPSDDPEERSRKLAYYANGEVFAYSLSEKQEIKNISEPVRWIAALNRYFIFSIQPRGAYRPSAVLQPQGTRKSRLMLVYPVEDKKVSIRTEAFYGPKDINLLNSVESTLGEAVDLSFGFLGVIAQPLTRPMLYVMKWFYGFTQNYGVAIILLTLVIKILTYPLVYKSMKSMRQMAKVQPEIQKIREKYKDDKEKLNREMMEFMRSQGYNPLSGCLPILLQMPIFIALYSVLYSSVELYEAPFILWIQDLSSKDPYFITPVLATVTMVLQQKLSPSSGAMDPTQQKIMNLIPLVFGAVLVTLPAGLTLYILTNVIVSILQQLLINRKLGLPHDAQAKPAKT